MTGSSPKVRPRAAGKRTRKGQSAPERTKSDSKETKPPERNILWVEAYAYRRYPRKNGTRCPIGIPPSNELEHTLPLRQGYVRFHPHMLRYV